MCRLCVVSDFVVLLSKFLIFNGSLTPLTRLTRQEDVLLNSVMFGEVLPLQNVRRN